MGDTKGIEVFWLGIKNQLRRPAFKKSQRKTQMGYKRNFNAKTKACISRYCDFFFVSSTGYHAHATVHRQPLAGDVFAGL